jgi:two-component sensor histidine kinase
MKFSESTLKSKIKIALFFLAVVLALASLFFTRIIVQKIEQREREIAELYANSLTYLANSESVGTDFTFIFEHVIQRIDFPLIMTDANDNPIYEEGGSGYRNLDIDPNMSEEEMKIYLRAKVRELGEEFPPIIVYYPKGVVWKKIYYGNSNVVLMLKYFPYAQIIFAVIFLLIAYASFNYFRKSEASMIWVGMSKETAHQLGTPISSLMGWNELLILNYKNPVKVLDIAEEMSDDLQRLNKIANRFSQIGSKPELKTTNIYELLDEIRRYFERRFPQMGKKITINIIGDKNVKAKVNADLFEWVIENLIKNARDAIENQEGEITITISENENSVELEIRDNGKGITAKNKRDIFKPGFSTKKRGWGLGLSLSKRIIDEYHGGKLFLKETSERGTTFGIVIPKK